MCSYYTALVVLVPVPSTMYSTVDDCAFPVPLLEVYVQPPTSVDVITVAKARRTSEIK